MTAEETDRWRQKDAEAERESVCVCVRTGLFVVQIRAAAGCELRQLAAQYGRVGKGLICVFMCAWLCVFR